MSKRKYRESYRVLEGGKGALAKAIATVIGQGYCRYWSLVVA